MSSAGWRITRASELVAAVSGQCELHQAGEGRRDLDDREAAGGLTGRGVQPQREVEAERREQRKRTRQVDSQRCQHRQRRNDGLGKRGGICNEHDGSAEER